MLAGMSEGTFSHVEAHVIKLQVQMNVLSRVLLYSVRSDVAIMHVGLANWYDTLNVSENNYD